MLFILLQMYENYRLQQNKTQFLFACLTFRKTFLNELSPISIIFDGYFVPLQPYLGKRKFKDKDE